MLYYSNQFWVAPPQIGPHLLLAPFYRKNNWAGKPRQTSYIVVSLTRPLSLLICLEKDRKRDFKELYRRTKEGEAFYMKISGLLSVMVIAIIVYCVCNFIILNPSDVIADDGDTVISAKRSYKGPFGVDSQKFFNHAGTVGYEIGIVTDINFERNDDGTWYVYYCELFNELPYPLLLFFTSPYPQQYDLKVGDFIGFSAETEFRKEKGETRKSYSFGRILDNISSQSIRCNIDDVSELSTPFKELPLLSKGEEDILIVTGVIMAIEVIKNIDPEPDNPSDYLIAKAVMKCADGDLYIADFQSGQFMLESGFVLGIFVDPIHVNLPSLGAFGEGDIVSIIQTSPVDNLSFPASYVEFIPKKEPRTKTVVPPVKPDINQDQKTETQETESQELVSKLAVMDAESDAKATTDKFWWFSGTCMGTTFLTCLFCGLPSMAIASIYEPPPPASRLIGKSPEYVEVYQKTYKEKVRSHQMTRATLGCIVGSVLSAAIWSRNLSE